MRVSDGDTHVMTRSGEVKTSRSEAFTASNPLLLSGLGQGVRCLCLLGGIAADHGGTHDYAVRVANR